MFSDFSIHLPVRAPACLVPLRPCAGARSPLAATLASPALEGLLSLVHHKVPSTDYG